MAWRATVSQFLTAALSDDRMLHLDSVETGMTYVGPAAGIVTYALELTGVQVRQDATTEDFYVDGTVSSYEAVQHGSEANMTSAVDSLEYPLGGMVTLKVTDRTPLGAVLELAH